MESPANKESEFATALAPKPVAPVPEPFGYRGRFAPSPTGSLHLGSLLAAAGSYLAARHARGHWLVRIEDLDPPREVSGSADSILQTLEAFGFQWDGPVIRQSTRTEAYEAAADLLRSTGLTYECTCSRTEIAAAGDFTTDSDEQRYPGWCRKGILAPERARALRFRVPAGIVSFVDELQGKFASDIGAAVGDFVIRRRDGWFAYQLAVVVDDAQQGITHVVRGSDLLASTPRQILLQRALGLSIPGYAHLPLAVDLSGAKLAKSAGSGAIDLDHPADQLWLALQLLLQHPPVELRRGSIPELWEWAIAHWTPDNLAGLRTLPVRTPG